MLDFEVALARAQARAGLVPDRSQSTSPPRRDFDRLAEAGRASGNPAAALAESLPDGAHRGATEPGRDGHGGDAGRASHAAAASTRSSPASPPRCARLAAEHRAHADGGAHAAAAGAADHVRAQGGRLARGRGRGAGPAGRGAARRSSWAARPARSPRSATRVCRCCRCWPSELALAEPVLPWHTRRGRIGQLGAALALAAGAVEKIALDVKLMAQTEVGELSESSAGGRGGSSTLPHKRNPVGSALAIACAHGVRGAASRPDRRHARRSTSARPAPGRPSGTRSRGPWR